MSREGSELVHEGHRIARKFFTGTSSSYDAVVGITTLGQDAAWKRAILELISRGDYRALDLACGTGILTLAIANKVAFVLGVDLMEKSIRLARKKARDRTIENAVFGTSAAEAIPAQDDSFDFVTASYLPKYCDIDLVVSESARVLRRGGVLIMHDFTYPRAPAMRGLWNAYFGVLRVAGIFTPSWRPVLNELDRVVRQSRWVDLLVRSMEQHGFRNVRCRNLTYGTAAIVWGSRDAD